MRIEGWEVRLAEYLDAPVGFAWGACDCALWSAGWVNLATGEDFAADWKGRYSTEAELHELLTERGFASPADIPASVGLREVHPRNAQRGDVVIWNGCLGICAGMDSWFLTESGTTRVRTRLAQRAWRV